MGIVGRREEQAALRSAVGAALGGHARSFVVVGAAGVGKTTMLDAVADVAAGSGFRVARGAASEFDGRRPLAALAQALDLDLRSRDLAPPEADAGGAVQRDLDEAALASTMPGGRFRAIDAVCGRVDELLASGPLAVLLDDLHWADDSTITTVRRLMTVTGSPLLLVVTTRPEGDLGVTVGSGTATHLQLEPLDRQAVAGMLAELVGGPPGPGLLGLAGAAAGNPLLLSELVGILRREGSLRAGASGVDVDERAGRTALDRRLRSPTGHLSGEAASVARVGSVLGTSFTLDELAVTGGWAAEQLTAPLEELLGSGLLRTVGVGFAFRHDLLRLAVEDELPPNARKALHLAAARSLAARGASAPRVARHFANGAEVGDDAAIEWLHRAAREAAPKSPASAVGILDDALALLPDGDPRSLAIEADRVEALGWSGRNAEAEPLCRALADRTEDPMVRYRVRRQLALSLLLSNRAHDAAAELEGSAAEVDDPTVRSNALGDCSLAAIAAGQLQSADELSAAAIAVGRPAGATTGVSIALAVRSRLLSFQGRFEDSLTMAEEAVVAAGDGIGARVQPAFFVAMTLNDLDRFDELDALLRRERAEVESQGIAWAVPLHHGTAADRHLCLGELGDAAAEAEAGLSVAEDTGSQLASVWMHAMLAQIALHGDDLAGARFHAERSTAIMVETAPMLGSDQHVLVQARVAEAGREPDVAAATLVGTWDVFTMVELYGGQRNLAVDAARLAHVTGDRAALARIAEQADRFAGVVGLASDAAAARFAAGLLADDPDDVLAAAATFAPGTYPLRRARMVEEAARLLWAAGRVDEAAAAMADARRAWLEMGAAGDARRAAETAKALGLPRVRSKDRPLSGWESLTATELLVVGLVAKGLSNGPIAAELGISRRTVETHLRHLYAKLHLETRVELAVEALRRT